MMVFIGIPLALWYLLDQSMILCAGKKLRPIVNSSLYGWIGLGVLIAYFVLRNLPFEVLDMLRP
jgi:hypothetical protein